jgi:diguanylate cyclase (GGDEF)-like protein
MAEDIKKELKHLKKEFLDAERAHEEEKEALLQALQVFGSVASMNPEYEADVKDVQTVLSSVEAVDTESLTASVQQLKTRIMTRESTEGFGPEETDLPEPVDQKVQEACRHINRIMVALFDDFYPLKEQLQAMASAIQLDCRKNPDEIEFQEPVQELLHFLDALKATISEDFQFINKTFLTLLDHVKELESTMSRDFNVKGQIKEIEYFEMKVNSEVGSIVESFNVYKTITEIRSTVISKIKNIKRLMTLKKEEELKRAEVTRSNMVSLKKKIEEAEKQAQEMTQKAERFENEAMFDGLTGLYNRKAFDEKLEDALAGFEKMNESFSLILFDVDRFKEINDSLGHVAGDKVLKKVADCLRETFRRTDFIARYGGDEFVVIIERLTKEMARERIVTFMEKLRRLRFTSHAKGDIQVGVSPGATTVMEGDTAESLLGRADEAMYDVKQKRRQGKR